ncbi:MAG: TauD/TfdA family dioxygenase [Cytophagales bacterium]|nr:TauD/TfdA family dioxygenase [Cytophagales bacterium]
MNFLKQVKFKNAVTTQSELSRALKEYKVVHLTDLPLDLDINRYYEEFADSIGVPYNVDEDLDTGESKPNRWIEISFDPEIQDRYRTAKTRQPLHTDDSYAELYNQKNVQFFYCTAQAPKGGATTFIDLDELVELIQLDNETELLSNLFSISVNFEKQGNKKIRKILDKDEIGYLANWNYYCIDKENTEEALQLVEDFHAYLESRIVTSGILTPVQLKPGEAVFFHDDRILHGRNSYFANKKGERCLVKGKIIFSDDFLSN